MSITKIRGIATVVMSVLLLVAACRPSYSQNGCGNNGGCGGNTPSIFFTYHDLVDNRSYDASGDVLGIPARPGQPNLLSLAEQKPGNFPALINQDIAGLIEAQAYGVRSIIGLEYVCFGNCGVLLPNWSSRFAEFVEAIRPYDSSLWGVYLCDEPYEAAAEGCGPGVATMAANLRMLAMAVRAQLPGVKICQIDQSPTLQGGYDVSFTDVFGIDAYGATPAQLDAYLTQIESMVGYPGSGKRTLVVPYAYSPTSPMAATLSYLIGQQATYESLVAAHPSVELIDTFLFNTQPGLYGLDGMPSVLASYEGWYERLAQGGK
jgi:hypothetical protein